MKLWRAIKIEEKQAQIRKFIQSANLMFDVNLKSECGMGNKFSRSHVQSRRGGAAYSVSNSVCSTEPEILQVSVTRKENADSFVDLYNNITYAEAQNEITNQEVITCYDLFGKTLVDRYEYYKTNNPKRTTQALVNKEVSKQLPSTVSDTLLRKRKERTQKIYGLFSKIGENKIQHVKSITASSISKLSQVEIDAILIH
ncbi:hypothetical protein F8M41_009162 [Gigaspora margarita]|uniref:Uncharacterized protein n=1 Tax=Gigaspora margarita TaxID=4874 RepID=A0A8H3X5J9_GIGMA|nr:hypothetical protein F8M41_009162 [Gigaspora margarita]